MAYLSKCNQIGSCPDCMMRTDNGLCKALSDTLFFKKCPFYKTAKQDPEAFEKIKELENYEKQNNRRSA